VSVMKDYSVVLIGSSLQTRHVLTINMCVTERETVVMIILTKIKICVKVYI